MTANGDKNGSLNNRLTVKERGLGSGVDKHLFRAVGPHKHTRQSEPVLGQLSCEGSFCVAGFRAIPLHESHCTGEHGLWLRHIIRIRSSSHTTNKTHATEVTKPKSRHKFTLLTFYPCFMEHSLHREQVSDNARSHQSRSGCLQQLFSKTGQTAEPQDSINCAART